MHITVPLEAAYNGLAQQLANMTKSATKIIVKVWAKAYEITVYQRSKTVWIAVGEYMGERIECKGLTQQSAVAHWREAARYRGNS